MVGGAGDHLVEGSFQLSVPVYGANQQEAASWDKKQDCGGKEGHREQAFPRWWTEALFYLTAHSPCLQTLCALDSESAVRWEWKDLAAFALSSGHV